MKNVRNFRFLIWLGFVLALAGTLFAQSTSDKVLVVNGKTVDSGVIQIGGHSYVDVETLAQLTNGTFVVDPHRVVLNIPVANAPAPTVAAATATVPATATAAAKTAADKATTEVTAPNGAAPVSSSAASSERSRLAEEPAPASACRKEFRVSLPAWPSPR